MKHLEALRILLAGTCGINVHLLQRECGISRETIHRWLSGRGTPCQETIDALGMFVWRRMNAHLILAPEDLGERLSSVAILVVERPAVAPLN